MTFLNPLALLGLAAAAIPVLIHLFNFRRPRRVDFSSLAFLKELQRSTMRRVRLQQWLLLALRVLAIVCLVLAFARPTVQSAWASLLGGRVETSTALVLDNSLSMTVRDAQGELLAQARELASAVVEAGQPGDEVFVVPTEAPEAHPGAFRHAGPALDALAEIGPEAGGGSLSAALARAFSLLEGAPNLNREVLLFSDLQASTFLDSSAVPAPEGVRLALLPLGGRRIENVALTEVRVASRVIEAGRPVQIEATLVNFGEAALEGYGLSLYLGGERVAQATAELPPGVPQTVRLTATPQATGWLEGEVRIEPDAFEFDNARFFVLHVPETRRVLVVEGTGRRADYLALALTLGRAPSRFEVETVAEGALAAQELARFDVVALVGPAALASGVRAALERFVREGGGLLVFPPEGEADDLNALLAALGGGRYGPLVGALGGERPVAHFGRVDLEHPLFEGVLEERDGQRQLESPDVFAAAEYVPGASDAGTLIALTNERPFLQEVRAGQGAALAFAVAPEEGWSDFPVRGLFVPLLHRAVAYLAAEAEAEEALLVGQPGVLRVAGAREGLRLVDPEGEVLAPEQRTVPGGVALELGEAARVPGVYDVLQGEPGEGPLVRRVAVNPDPREGDLAALSPEEAARRLEAATGADVLVLEAAGGLGAARVAEARTGVELWNVFLALALLFLVAELLVAMRWRPEPVPA